MRRSLLSIGCRRGVRKVACEYMGAAYPEEARTSQEFSYAAWQADSLASFLDVDSTSFLLVREVYGQQNGYLL